ncbi:hypothetical protein [Aeoliella sp. SH292]|uniref:hypothetical protein n=1 Tax=Aeoliella sp. SH292 TaxID=3454464 RepID=UPI003F9AD6E3
MARSCRPHRSLTLRPTNAWQSPLASSPQQPARVIVLRAKGWLDDGGDLPDVFARWVFRWLWGLRAAFRGGRFLDGSPWRPLAVAYATPRCRVPSDGRPRA